MYELNTITLENAYLIIETLRSLGVKHFCFSPGSRSTSFAIALGSLPKQYRSVHFDERGLGFHAVGLAKGSSLPVAIITTSGTAVANLFPAIAEASLSRVPLIILSADRPVELRNCGANQTMDQVKIFSSYIRFEADLPLSDPRFPKESLVSTFSYAFHKSLYGHPGPVHVNCMIRDTSFSKEDSFFASPPAPIYEPTETRPPESSFLKWAEFLSSYEKGIIILGRDALQGEAAPLLEAAEKLGFPIFSDVLSGGRRIGNHPCHIEYPDILLKTFENESADVILHIGAGIVSKTITSFLTKQRCPYFLVGNYPAREDPHFLVSHRMECETNLFFSSLCRYLPTKKNFWISLWKERSLAIKEELDLFFTANTIFSEPSIARFFRNFPNIFVSNSMPVRDADLFLFSEEGTEYVTANRGVSGIDGNIATAIGVARSLEKPLVALLGDMAALHDVNSLPLIKQSPYPVYLVVINNGGGGIFSFLPIAGKETLCDELFATEHSYSFASIAESFSIPFFAASTLSELSAAFENAQGRSCIIECKTNRKENVAYHQMIYDKVKDGLCSFIDLSETLVTGR